VELFDGFSVPFLFTSERLLQWHGAKVRAYFDPYEPRCNATLVLAENCRNGRAGDIIGSAGLSDDTASYARFALGLADDPVDGGRKLAGKAAQAMRRDTAAIMPGGRVTGMEAEWRGGGHGEWAKLGEVTGGKVTSDKSPHLSPSHLSPVTPAHLLPVTCAPVTDSAALAAELAALEAANAKHFND
jgi:hypothetical protein